MEKNWLWGYVKEAERITDKDGGLVGNTDGSKHPVYQTAWLIFGLDRLGIDSSRWKIPNDMQDSYSSLIWFMPNKGISAEKNKYASQYQYLEYAQYHFDKTIVENDNVRRYPISFEYNGLKANFESIKEFNKQYSVNKFSLPHIWSASEMFLYYFELDQKK